MKKVIERIVESPGAPNENDLWLNGKTLKRFQNGEWVAISGGSGSGGGSGCDCPEIEANPTIGDGDTTTPLENLKVGETIYGVSSGAGVLLVQGSFTGEYDSFVPSSGQPSYDEAKAAFKNGTCVMLVVSFESYGGTTGHAYHSVLMLLEGASEDPDGMLAHSGGNALYWPDPNWVNPYGEGGDDTIGTIG